MQAVRFISLLTLALTVSLSGCAGRSDLIPPESCPPGDKMVSQDIDGKGHTGIIGAVSIKESGEPLAGAFVNIYPDTISNLLGPSQFISLPTDAVGSYSVDVPPGTYYIVARKRGSGEATGPLSPGDFYSEHQRIVTRVSEGRLSVVNLEVVPMKAPMFFKKQVVEQQTDTAISGTLVDAEGKPLPGGFAMAYSDPDMKRLPDYASTLSDSEGRFTLFLPEGGSYYLAARIHAWDMPRPGEPYGVYGAKTPEKVTVATGEKVEQLVIRMVPFSGTYAPGKSRRPF